MKLSQQLYNDFLQEPIDYLVGQKEDVEYMLTMRTYPMSYNYLIDLINKIKELEKHTNNE